MRRDFGVELSHLRKRSELALGKAAVAAAVRLAGTPGMVLGHQCVSIRAAVDNGADIGMS